MNKLFVCCLGHGLKQLIKSMSSGLFENIVFGLDLRPEASRALKINCHPYVASLPRAGMAWQHGERVLQLCTTALDSDPSGRVSYNMFLVRSGNIVFGLD